MDDKGSSIASFVEKENFSISKVLGRFYEYTIKAGKINDKKIRILNMTTLMETLILTTIITCTFVFYNGNLNQIGQYI